MRQHVLAFYAVILCPFPLLTYAQGRCTANTGSCLVEAEAHVVAQYKTKIIRGSIASPSQYFITSGGVDYPAPAGTTDGAYDVVAGGDAMTLAPTAGMLLSSSISGIDPSTGFTILVEHSSIEGVSTPASPGASIALWTSDVQPQLLIALGLQNTTTGYKWSLGKAQSQGSSHYWQSPWDMNLIGNTGQFLGSEYIYYTFTSDGKVRIDRFSLYDYLLFFHAYQWDEATLDAGYPHAAFPAGTPTTPPSKISSRMPAIVTLGNGYSVVNSAADPNFPMTAAPAFEGATFFSIPLSTKEVIAYQKSIGSSLFMPEDSLPCNTGLFLNGSVSTPCGSGGPGKPPSDMTALYRAALPAMKGADVILAANLVKSPATSCAVITADAVDSRGLNTTSIQNQINACAAKASGSRVYVELSGAKGANFTSGPLYLKPNVSLWLDSGITLNASTNSALFQRTTSTPTAACYSSEYIPVCGSLDSQGTSGCDALINSCRADFSGVEGSGTIEGHGWDTVKDTYGSSGATWWARSATAKAGGYAKGLSAPQMIQFLASNDISVQGVTVHNAPRYEVTLDRVNVGTIANINIATPTANHASQGPAYNTDGIDPISSSNIKIQDVTIASGDDNIAIKASDGGVNNITVQNATLLGPGHGLSIGSETSGGVQNVTATNINFRGTVNGLRIKSASDRGGLVTKVKYDHVCMTGVSHAIEIDPAYSTNTGTLYPNFKSVELDNVYSDDGTVKLDGYSTQLPLNVKLNNVFVAGLGNVDARNANITEITDPRFPHTINIPSDIGGTITQSTGVHTVPNGIQAYCNANNPRTPNGVLVDQSGKGNFLTIQAAVDAAPADGSNIYINPGTYKEVVTVNKPFIHLIGTGSDPSKVILTYNNSARTLDATGTALGTSDSATLFALGDDFLARNFTIQNTFDMEHGQDAVGSQAVALFASGDRGVYRNMNIIGRQDTLYVNNKGCNTVTQICQPSRQYFADSYIEGNVDYVFGSGRAFFDTCQFHSVMHDTLNGEVTVTAQSRQYANEDSGYVFSHSYFTADTGLTNVWLGRPWKPYSTVVLLNSNINFNLVPAAFQEWIPGTTNYLWTAYYGEYGTTGAGATGPREQWEKALTATQAGWYSFKSYMAGPDSWDPSSTF